MGSSCLCVCNFARSRYHVRMLVSDRAWFQLHSCGREYHSCELQLACYRPWASQCGCVRGGMKKTVTNIKKLPVQLLAIRLCTERAASTGPNGGHPFNATSLQIGSTIHSDSATSRLGVTGPHTGATRPQQPGGVTIIHNGATSLQDGIPSLRASATSFQDGMPSLQDGIPSLRAGATSLRGGMISL